MKDKNGTGAAPNGDYFVLVIERVPSELPSHWKTASSPMHSARGLTGSDIDESLAVRPPCA